MRYLARTLPSLGIKTGCEGIVTLADSGQNQASIDMALNAAQSGSPLLFLDVRERPLVEAADRVALIEAAKTALEKHCDALLVAGLVRPSSRRYR